MRSSGGKLTQLLGQSCANWFSLDWGRDNPGSDREKFPPSRLLGLARASHEPLTERALGTSGQGPHKVAICPHYSQLATGRALGEQGEEGSRVAW